MKKNADTTWQKSMHLKTTLINPKIQCIIIIKEASEETLKLLNHDEQDLSFICGRIESDVTKNTLARKNLRNNENYNQSSWICKNHSASLSRSHGQENMDEKNDILLMQKPYNSKEKFSGPWS